MISAIQKQRLRRQMLPFVDSLIETERGLLVLLNGQNYVIPECDIKEYVDCDSYELRMVEVNIFAEKIIHPTPFTLEYLLEHWNIVQNYFFTPKDDTTRYSRILTICENGVFFNENSVNYFVNFEALAQDYYIFNGVDFFNCIIDTSYEITEKTKNVTFKTK